MLTVSDNHGHTLSFDAALPFDNTHVGTAQQNSENIGFFSFANFDPTVAAIYTIELAMKQGDTSLGQVDIQVNVGAVPEPATWAMMILGFAGVGLVSYRRRRSAPLAAA